MSTPQRPLFGKFSLFLIFVVGLGSLVFAVALGWVSDPRDEVESIDTDTFSISALGHKAFFELLEKQKIDVVRARYKSHEEVGERDLLVIAEPHVMVGDEDESPGKELREYVHKAPRVLLVLPKRDGLKDVYDKEWIGAVFDVPEYDIQYALDLAGVASQPVRTHRHADEMTFSSTVAAPVGEVVIPSVQLIKPGPGISPLIWTDHGILFARVESSVAKRPVYLLADPDLFANHGLHRDVNAQVVMSILTEARGAQPGKVVFDEVLHGHKKIPSLWERLLDFPFVLATVQVLILLLFVLWAGIMRFGPPAREGAARAPGKAFFIDNTAELLTFGGHSAHTVERYVWMVLYDLAAELNAPPRMTQVEVLDWLQHMADRRGVEIKLKVLCARAGAMADGTQRSNPKKLLGLALTIYRFKRKMLHES